MRSKAFTLAEIMIVLAIIGILSAILLPAAMHSVPDENVLKFKKANNTLGTAIRELVSSGEYYSGGDLGIKADGGEIDGSHEGDITYFCETLADILNAKNVNCSKSTICKDRYCWTHLGKIDGVEYLNLGEIKNSSDEACLNSEKEIGAEIITTDDITYYQVSPIFTFGIRHKSATDANAASEEREPFEMGTHRSALILNDEGFIATYKFICLDIDGINKGEDPFGYALRYDGKIIPGARAQEWINKNIQNRD